MKVISTNSGERRSVQWSGKRYETGIFKTPVLGGIYLGATDVLGDSVVDRRYHGGVDKACYTFSKEEYAFWEKLYPKLEFSNGMFGENLTVEGLNEDMLRIGDTFEVGDAIIQVSEPRQPCVKLNIRFNSSAAMKDFISRERCGAYFRVLKEGQVKSDDELVLIDQEVNALTVREVFNLLYGNGSKEKALQSLQIEALGNAVKTDLKRIWKLS